MNEVTNNDDVIDSRDVIERIAELENEAVSRFAGGREDLSYGEIADAQQSGDALDEDERDELAALRKLASEGESLEDWQHGATLIRYTYFTEYAKQLADDIGAIDANASWPLNHIDWEAAADALHQDYTDVEFDGVTYFAR